MDSFGILPLAAFPPSMAVMSFLSFTWTYLQRPQSYAPVYPARFLIPKLSLTPHAATVLLCDTFKR